MPQTLYLTEAEAVRAAEKHNPDPSLWSSGSMPTMSGKKHSILYRLKNSRLRWQLEFHEQQSRWIIMSGSTKGWRGWKRAESYAELMDGMEEFFKLGHRESPQIKAPSAPKRTTLYDMVLGEVTSGADVGAKTLK